MSEQANIATDSAGWIDVTEMGCPVPDKTIVDIERKNGVIELGVRAGDKDWPLWRQAPDQIVRYRLSDWLADERSARADPIDRHPLNARPCPESSNSSDPSAIAGAIDILRSLAIQIQMDAREAEIEASSYLTESERSVDGQSRASCAAAARERRGQVDALRTLLADHARLEAENARLREGLMVAAAVLCGDRLSKSALIEALKTVRALTNREGQDARAEDPA